MLLLTRAVRAPATWRRWAHLVIGGALLMPYWFLGMVLASLLPTQRPGLVGLVMLLFPLPATFVTGLVPAVRYLEATAARELLRGPSAALRPAMTSSWQTRARTGLWFGAHLHVGVVVSAMSLAVPPFAVVLGLLPVIDWGLGSAADPGPLYAWKHSGWVWLAPPAGLLTLLALLGLIVLAGAGLSRLGPVLLGPSPAERVAELEAAARRLAERNRLARELHDSVGHALSVVTLQAAAAGRVLDRDPDFARQALGAIEESARAALEDLDHVLGLLREDRREDGARTAPQPTLGDLERLLEQTRIAGVKIDAEIGAELEHVPAAVSREAYRIVQEGLTNALRHAGKVPVRLRIAVRGERLEIGMDNPLAGRDAAGGDHGGGRGLGGVRERVTVLRGTMAAGPEAGEWRVRVELPLRSGS
ncbi:sensor histidine kinase [Actinomadura hibisca]|uniref:sensor histidine kinase n=1 Tax=Actinomadura hibisca TaxID=68565 RepID=UPI00082A6E59|nr:histidine kinase [Actinomadura hibisca]